MEPKNKWIAGVVALVLFLVGGAFTVEILDDRVTVTLPSDICDEAKLIVHEDYFKLKCGWRVAFEADTIVEYFKTYGTDEWVKDYRYTRSIELGVQDFGDHFDVVRKTKYRKGQQYVEDGILFETYSFSKDKVKISYLFNSNNKAKHRISMRIKKQYKSYLDVFDPFGHAAVRSDNLVSYSDYGDLKIDPIVSLYSPSTGTTSYNEGETIPLICNYTDENDTLVNVSLYWNASGGTGDWKLNETVLITTNGSTTFSKVIPHRSENGSDSFVWNCLACNTTSCTWNTTANYTVNPVYRPNIPGILNPEDEDLNLLNGTGWGLGRLFPDYTNLSDTTRNKTIFVNWSDPGHPDIAGNISWFLYYYTAADPTTMVHIQNTTSNLTYSFEFNVSALAVGRYYLNLTACTSENTSLCVDDVTTNFIDVFDYEVTLPPGVNTIRFSPLDNVTTGAPYGQTSSRGIFKIDWLDYIPTGIINVTLNITAKPACATIYASNSSTWDAGAYSLTNRTKTVMIHNVTTDPDYLWLWITKNSCSTGSTDINFYMEVLD